MIKYLFILFICASCTVKNDNILATTTNKKKDFTLSENIPIHSFKSFESLLHKKNDTTYIINFWATWCVPCVEELPYFEKINTQYKDRKVKVILTSLDFPDKIDSKLIPFIKSHAIQSKIIVLDAPDQNKWIPKVNSDWSGAIPATLIYNKNKSSFYEQSFSFSELEDLVQQHILIQ